MSCAEAGTFTLEASSESDDPFSEVWERSATLVHGEAFELFIPTSKDVSLALQASDTQAILRRDVSHAELP